MFRKISKSEDFLKSLQVQGKVENLNSTKHIKTTSEMNVFMEEVRKDFIYKNFWSNKNAEKIILR